MLLAFWGILGRCDDGHVCKGEIGQALLTGYLVIPRHVWIKAHLTRHPQLCHAAAGDLS